MCVKPEVSVAPAGAKTGMCKTLVRKSKCEYFKNQDSIGRIDSDFGILNEAKENIMDLEDLVKFGTTRAYILLISVCPFYLSQKVLPDAEVIFLPYNYLLDPKSRKSMGIDISYKLFKLRNSIIIFDEGHNLESICSEVTSFEISDSELAQALIEIRSCQRSLGSGVVYDLFHPIIESDCKIVGGN